MRHCPIQKRHKYQTTYSISLQGTESGGRDQKLKILQYIDTQIHCKFYTYAILYVNFFSIFEKTHQSVRAMMSVGAGYYGVMNTNIK